MQFRSLKADEIKVRVDRVTEKGAVLLLYKDARVDMDILDETVQPENWQRKHYERKGNMFCSVGINANFEHQEKPPEWVWKDDAGTESYTAKEKGESSDSFKRACVNWGIGRELYSAPRIFVTCKTVEKKDGRGYELANKFALSGVYVSHVKTVDGQICELSVVDSRGNVIYSSAGKSREPIDPESIKKVDVNEKISAGEAEAIRKRVESLGMTALGVCDKYEIPSLLEMTKAQLADCNAQLNDYEDRQKAKEKKNG